MLTKEERKEHVAVIECEKAELESRISELNKMKNSLNKSVVFEDTYQGAIHEAEVKAQEAINGILQDLTSETGNSYAGFELEHINDDGFVVCISNKEVDGMINEIRMANECAFALKNGCKECEAVESLEEYSPYGKKQKEAVEALVKYCSNHNWSDASNMKNWIIKKVLEA